MDSCVCIEDFGNLAKRKLGRNAHEYINSGSDNELTMYGNRNGYQSWTIIPRVLRDVSTRNLETIILGKPTFPLGIAPTAFQRVTGTDGEISNARAAEKFGTIFIQSTFSNSSIEEVAQAAPNCRKWFQLFIQKDRDLTRNLIQRAEKAGFEAIVLTVDAQVIGKRRVNERNPFQWPKHLKLANFSKELEQVSNVKEYVSSNLDQSITFKIIQYVRQISKLPIVVKGILTVEDALLCVEANVNGIYISNHGGRQVDSILPTIDALHEIVAAVQGSCEIYIDGGILRGTDIFKALALGANMVFVGRPAIWGLVVGAEEGVDKVLNIFKEEFDLTMALSGTKSVREINSSFVKRNLMSKI